MFLVMMLHSWGRGETINDADKKARSEGGHGRKKMKRIVWQFDPEKTPEAFINEFGSLCWKGEKPNEIERTA